MIATILGPGSSSTVSNSTASAAAFDVNSKPVNSGFIPEQGVVKVTPTGRGPAIFGVPRRPEEGYRGINQLLARIGIPRVPQGPPKITHMGPGMTPAGRTPNRVSSVQQFTPAPTIAQVGEWWETLA